MTDVANIVVTAIMLGLLYSLIASSLNVIFGVLRVINFAHGSFVVLGSYATFWLWRLYGLNPLVSLLIIVPSFLVLGVIVYYVFVTRLVDSENTEGLSLLLFFGVAIVMESVMTHLWGSQERGIPFPFEGTLPVSVTLGNITIATGRIIGAVLALVVMVVLALFFYRTYYGKAVRAIIQNREATQFLGIDTHKVSALSFGVGIAMAGIAGVALTLIFPTFAPNSGQQYTIIAFVIVIIGGIGDPIGAVGGALFFALIEQAATAVLPWRMVPLLSFVVLTAVILVRPEGILRTRDLRAISARLRGFGKRVVGGLGSPR